MYSAGETSAADCFSSLELRGCQQHSPAYSALPILQSSPRLAGSDTMPPNRSTIERLDRPSSYATAKVRYLNCTILYSRSETKANNHRSAVDSTAMPIPTTAGLGAPTQRRS